MRAASHATRASSGVAMDSSKMPRVLAACDTTKGGTAIHFSAAVPAGIEGEFTSDVPRQVDGGTTCTADYQAGGRNPGLIRIVANEELSFYEDRAGAHPLASSCHYVSRGTRPDPIWYGTSPGKSLTSIWMLYELASGPPACDAMFHFVSIRPPEGQGPLEHMHVRYGARGTSLEALVAESAAESREPDPCVPWWSVYCKRGFTGCDPD